MNLVDVLKEFRTEDDCLEFLEKQRWPDGIRCPTCGCAQISRITRRSLSKNKRTRIYQCLEKTCKQQFSATNGSIFHDSKLPLTLWFAAMALIIDAKKGISTRQVQRHLGIGSYRSAWYMCHRIRRAMETMDRPQLGGVVEIDETYVGGTTRGNGWASNKTAVIGIKQRGGELRFFKADDIKSGTLARYIRENVSKDVEAVMTDELAGYPLAMIEAGIHGTRHKTIRHKARVYVDGDITTNGIESAFSLFKRGIVGSFHFVSAKHLQRYLSEFEYRFNVRNSKDRFTGIAQRMVRTSEMPYAALVSSD